MAHIECKATTIQFVRAPLQTPVAIGVERSHIDSGNAEDLPVSRRLAGVRRVSFYLFLLWSSSCLHASLSPRPMLMTMNSCEAHHRTGGSHPLRPHASGPMAAAGLGLAGPRSIAPACRSPWVRQPFLDGVDPFKSARSTLSKTRSVETCIRNPLGCRSEDLSQSLRILLHIANSASVARFAATRIGNATLSCGRSVPSSRASGSGALSFGPRDFPGARQSGQQNGQAHRRNDGRSCPCLPMPFHLHHSFSHRHVILPREGAPDQSQLCSLPLRDADHAVPCLSQPHPA